MQMSITSPVLQDEHIGTDSDSLGNVPPYLGDNSGEFEDFNSFLSNGVENWSSVVQPLELGTPTVNSAVHDEGSEESILIIIIIWSCGTRVDDHTLPISVVFIFCL